MPSASRCCLNEVLGLADAQIGNRAQQSHTIYVAQYLFRDPHGKYCLSVVEIPGLWYAVLMKLLRLLTGNTRETSKLVAAVDKSLIERAFVRRAKEIES